MRHRFFLAQILALGLVAGFGGACGGGAATGDLDQVKVTLGRFEISLANVSGHPLVEVTAEIVPVGSGTHFVAHPDRLENGEERSVAHSSFIDRDSVPFSPRNCRARSVIVTAKDMDGKPVRVVVPFKS